MKHRSFAFTDKIYNWLAPKAKGEDADIVAIKELIGGDKSCMISRFGSTELQTIAYIRYFPLFLALKKRTYYNIQNASGFFPVSHDNLLRYYKLYKEDVKDLDLLVSWRIEEFLFQDWLKNKKTIRKESLESFFKQKEPWTSVLAGKKILVVHPFAETIQEQYEHHRSELFSQAEVLPKFAKLETIKAVQSIASNPVEFDSWFDALEWMKSEINERDFDIALLGCGAYAFHLAAHIKRLGKKAIHLGGILQFLFGIKGVRYEEDPETAAYINQYFVYPKASDRPKNADRVEGGCYWG